MALTKKWFEVKIFTSNHFRTHAQRERERDRTQITPWTLSLRRFLNLIKYSFDFDFESHPDRTLRLCGWTQSPDHATNPKPRSHLRLRRDHTDHTEIAPIAPQDRTETTPIAPRSHQSLSFPDLVSPSSVDTNLSLTLSSFFSQLDRIWWIFLVGFCFCVYLLRNGIIYLFGSWENVRNKKKMCFLYYFQQHNQTLENIFQSIFWNATKHLKIFSFPENSISEKYLLSGKYFTWTKHSHNDSKLWHLTK